MTGVVFDFGNVLYKVDYPAMARKLAGEKGRVLLEGFVGSPVQRAYETGRAGLDDVLEELRRLGFSVGRDRFLEAYLSIFSPIPGVRQILERLGRRRPLGLLSNTSPEHARLFIERTREFNLFDAAVFSFEVGAMKPDPLPYRAIASRLGLRARELVYTDDVEAYTRAAEAEGMAGVAFAGAADLARRLVALGLRELEDLVA